MPTITRIRRRRGGGTVLAVELDGRPWLALEEPAVARLGWRTGRELDGTDLRAGEEEARRGAVERRAARLLASRPHARAELEAKLTRTGGAAEARAVVRRCEEAGWVDDAAFAARVVERRLAQGYGPERIRDDLRRAGVEEGTAAAALAAVEPERIEDALREAAGPRPGPGDRHRLVGRGFHPDQVEDLVGAPDDL